MAVALTPDAFLNRSASTAWNVYFSYCGWRRIDTDRGQTTVLTYLGHNNVGSGFQITASPSRQLIVYRVNDFADLLGGTGPTLDVGTWYFFGLTTIAASQADGIEIYYAAEDDPSLTQVTATLLGAYGYNWHGVGARPGTDGQDSVFRLHGSAENDRTWTDTTLTPAEMLAEYQSPTPVRTAGLWSAWPMADSATAGDDASGGGRPLTANTGIGAIDTTEGPFDTGTGAVKLTPTAHYTRAGAPNGTDQTWCGWIRPDAAPPTSGYRTVISQDAGAEDVDWFSLNFDDTDGLELYVNNRATPITTSGPVPTLGAWFFVGVVRSGTTWTFYWRAQDWELLEDETGTGSGDIGTNLRIGSEFVVENAKTFEGGDSYWRVFETALTEAQLYAESESSVAIVAEWADWPIDDVVTQTDDISGNNHPLTADAGNGSFTDTTGPQVFGPTPVQGSGLLAGGGVLDLAATRSKATDGSLAGGGSLAISGTRASAGAFSLDGAGSLSLAGAAATSGALSLDGGGALGLAGTRSRSAAFSLDGGGTLALAGSETVPGSGSLDGGGQLAMSGTRAKAANGALDGGGALALAGTATSHERGSGLLDGGGVLAMAGSRVKGPVAMALQGGGILRLTGDAPTGDVSGCDRIPIPPQCRPVRVRVGESAYRVPCAEAPPTPGSAGLDIACNT